MLFLNVLTIVCREDQPVVLIFFFNQFFFSHLECSGNWEFTLHFFLNICNERKNNEQNKCTNKKVQLQYLSDNQFLFQLLMLLFSSSIGLILFLLPHVHALP